MQQIIKTSKETGITILLLLLLHLNSASQVNLVLNSNFEEVIGSNGTKVLSLSSAANWQEKNTADLYLRDSTDGHGNIVRIAPYFNEVMIGTLKRKTAKNEEMLFRFDLLSRKKQKFKLELVFCKYPCDSMLSLI